MSIEKSDNKSQELLYNGDIFEFSDEIIKDIEEIKNFQKKLEITIAAFGTVLSEIRKKILNSVDDVALFSLEIDGEEDGKCFVKGEGAVSSKILEHFKGVTKEKKEFSSFKINFLSAV